MSERTRNQPCPCGSGLRFKQCHGKIGAATAPQADAAGDRHADLMARALAHRQGQRYDDAVRDYEAALEQDPTRHDARYMLAGLWRERGDGGLAKAHILEALDLTGWKSALYRRFLSALLSDEAPAGPDPVPGPGGGCLAEQAARARTVSLEAPLVTVVVPCRNHVTYVEAALRSLFRQTYRQVEMVVIDDGSDDGSADAIRRCLDESPFPHRFVARERRGASETVNEAAELATGAYICLLNSDDFMHEDRVRRMVANIAGTGAQWGFSSTECVDADGNYIDPLHNRYVYDLRCAVGDAGAAPTIGFALMTQNIAASSGNLFVSRKLFRALGGFHRYRHVHGWDFCLRALQLAEPVFVREALYCKRLHRGNQPSAMHAALHAEAAEVCRRYVQWGCTAEQSVSPVAPCVARWPTEFRKAILETGLADLVDAPTLRLLALGRS
ncbi:MAG: glycosyltransferase [Betaproteobacteria bacterium]